MRTFSPKPDDITRAWHVVDADGLVLGRLATEVARILRGKHKPIFAPHVDTGDHVIVVNAAKVVLTSGKADRSSPTATAATPAGSRRPATPTCWPTGPRRSCATPSRACCPKNRLGRQQLTKLKVYAGRRASPRGPVARAPGPARRPAPGSARSGA